MFTKGAAVLALALAPALLRWWWGRSLAKLADDPLIAERLHAHHTRVGLLCAVCLVALGVGWPTWTIWTVPLVFFAQSAASYPLTRRLYGETWSLGASVWFYTRLPAAIFGFMAVLAAAPWIPPMAGRWDWAVAIALAAALVVWERYHADYVRAALRCEPMTDPVLLDRFAALVAASGIPAPRFDWVRMKGGVLANALALPCLKQSSVIFTDTLVSRLTADETVAICAHEIAHLEYYDRTRLRRFQIGNWILIAVACGVPPIVERVFSLRDHYVPAMACSAAVAVTLMLRSRHRQRNETASDVRAVELTGDPHALARALTALHAIARVPRRWDQQREQQATHPSLARRIRDINAAAGVAVAGAIESAPTFRAARADVAVTFETAHLRWQDAPGTTHLLEYGTLAELRLHVSPGGDPTLIAVGPKGRRWKMPARPEDAAALQSMLDTVDGRLGSPAVDQTVSAPFARIFAIFGATLAAMLAQFALALVAILAALVPAPALLNASGAAAFVTAAVLLTHGTGEGATDIAFAIVLGLIGAVFLWIAHTRRDDEARQPDALVSLLGVAAILVTAGIVLGGVNPVRLHQGARQLSAAPVLLVAVAAACWRWRTRPHVRYVALAAAATGAITVAMGSTLFLDRAGRDLFLVRAAELRLAGLQAGPEASFDIPFEIESLRLSPHGRLAAFIRSEAVDGSSSAASPSFHVRLSDGSVTELEASDVAFIDDRRVLLLAVDRAGARITVASFDGAPAVNWRQRIPGIRSASLTYHHSGNQWVLVGRGAEGNVVRATGTVGESGFRQQTWKALADQGGWINAIGTRGDAAIALQMNYDYGIVGPALSMRMPTPLIRTYPESRLWRLGPGPRVEAGRSRLDVTCNSETRDEENIVCTAFDGVRTRIVAIEPATAAVTPLGQLDGPFHAHDGVGGSWLTGWWRGAATAVHLDTRVAFRLPRHPREFVTIVAPAEHVIATAAPVDVGMRVRVYALGVATKAARAE